MILHIINDGEYQVWLDPNENSVKSGVCLGSGSNYNKAWTAADLTLKALTRALARVALRPSEPYVIASTTVDDGGEEDLVDPVIHGMYEELVRRRR